MLVLVYFLFVAALSRHDNARNSKVEHRVLHLDAAHIDTFFIMSNTKAYHHSSPTASSDAR